MIWLLLRSREASVVQHGSERLRSRVSWRTRARGRGQKAGVQKAGQNTAMQRQVSGGDGRHRGSGGGTAPAVVTKGDSTVVLLGRLRSLALLAAMQHVTIAAPSGACVGSTCETGDR